jgi:hypothetical protein
MDAHGCSADLTSSAAVCTPSAWARAQCQPPVNLGGASETGVQVGLRLGARRKPRPRRERNAEPLEHCSTHRHGALCPYLRASSEVIRGEWQERWRLEHWTFGHANCRLELRGLYLAVPLCAPSHTRSLGRPGANLLARATLFRARVHERVVAVQPAAVAAHSRSRHRSCLRRRSRDQASTVLWYGVLQFYGVHMASALCSVGTDERRRTGLA